MYSLVVPQHASMHPECEEMPHKLPGLSHCLVCLISEGIFYWQLRFGESVYLYWLPS